MGQFKGGGAGEMQKAAGKREGKLIINVWRKSFQKPFLATFMGTFHLCGTLLASTETNYKVIHCNFRQNSIREERCTQLKIQVSNRLNYNEYLNCFL